MIQKRHNRFRGCRGYSLTTETLYELTASAATNRPAILGDGGLELSYAELAETSHTLAAQLASIGLSRSARIAIATRNGPSAVVAFLGASSVGVAAPLNPAYTEAEFRFGLSDLPASILITDGSVAAASRAAEALGIREVRLGEGLVLDVPGRGPVREPSPEDVALVLHTSGTTGRPKRVPLSHANLARSARNVAASLELSPDDRCLNVMPLFHIHGIVAAVLATLSSGGSVVCTAGFDAFRFFGWLEASRATWYTAVPTMHQAIVARGRAHLSVPASSALRFVRSSSSPLPPPVMRDVEDLFGVPMLEAYGMTEASHQVCANPLPPGVRKPGSVGVPSGVELRVVGADGASLQAGQTGEVVIRGGSVTAGYEAIDPSEFTLPGGWLRTGDLGYLDDDGYLVLAGRIKELVNRGGEKISPREVEDVLITYPGVREVVVFAVPHAKLGEDIAAAIVPEPADRPLDIAELRAFAGAQLAPFKVPRQVVVVEAIPLGPTGKPQRLGMAGRLGLA